jgi:hypothetical protein
MSSILAKPSLGQASRRKVAHPPQRRQHTAYAYTALPYYATHVSAPTLAAVQQLAVGVLARVLVAFVLEQKGVQDED